MAPEGHFLRRCERGEGVGEIALLRNIPRTATVIAHSAATVYQLHRCLFLTAVLGHGPTLRQAGRIAGERLATGGPGNCDTQGPDAPEPG
jgi:CRP-like cAMP-binding protein